METENIQGSCHCQTVNFEVQVDLEKTGTYKCNCSYCGKARNWGVMIKPNQFRWTKGESSLSEYQITPGSQNFYYFCKNCGVRICTRGFIEEIGGDFMSVMVSAFDGISPERLANLRVQLMNGHDNDWFNTPKVFSHL